MKHDKGHIAVAHIPTIEAKVPVPSITKAEHDRIVAAAVHSEHAAGSDERKKAVADAVAATREVCAQESDMRVKVLNAGTQDQTYAVEVAVTAAYEACAQIAESHWFSGGIAEEIRARAKKR
jgi:hypothetical protein